MTHFNLSPSSCLTLSFSFLLLFISLPPSVCHPLSSLLPTSPALRQNRVPRAQSIFFHYQSSTWNTSSLPSLPPLSLPQMVVSPSRLETRLSGITTFSRSISDFPPARSRETSQGQFCCSEGGFYSLDAEMMHSASNTVIM